MKLLYPGDIILMESEEKGLFRKLKDWFLGSKWGHAAIHIGTMVGNMPMVVESKGRGVQIRGLYASEGRYIKVLRYGEACGKKAAEKAYEIGNDVGAWYGYLDVPMFVIPRLFWLRLTGRNHGFGYRHNPYYICSELVAHAYSGILFDDDFIPLPGDFETLGLETIFEGVLAPMGTCRDKSIKF